MDTADAVALALAGLAVLIGASIAAVVVLRPPTRRDHPPSTLPGPVPDGDDAGADPVHGADAATDGDARTSPTTTPTTTTTQMKSPATSVADVSGTTPASPRITEPNPPTGPRIPTDVTGGDARPERDEGVAVAILADEDGNHRWRVSLSPTSDPITVDVFSFRAVGSNGNRPWQHELLVSPMGLEPGDAKSIGGPVDPTIEYTVSIAWVAHHPDGDSDTTRLLHIPVAEIKTWGINSAVARGRRPRE